jgi:hypothetical protein
MSLILRVLRISCEELAKHSPSVGFTFGEIFCEFPQTLTFEVMYFNCDFLCLILSKPYGLVLLVFKYQYYVMG